MFLSFQFQLTHNIILVPGVQRVITYLYNLWSDHSNTKLYILRRCWLAPNGISCKMSTILKKNQENKRQNNTNIFIGPCSSLSIFIFLLYLFFITALCCMFHRNLCAMFYMVIIKWKLNIIMPFKRSAKLNLKITSY